MTEQNEMVKGHFDRILRGALIRTIAMFFSPTIDTMTLLLYT